MIPNNHGDFTVWLIGGLLLENDGLSYGKESRLANSETSENDTFVFKRTMKLLFICVYYVWCNQSKFKVNSDFTICANHTSVNRRRNGSNVENLRQPLRVHISGQKHLRNCIRSSMIFFLNVVRKVLQTALYLIKSLSFIAM